MNILGLSRGRFPIFLLQHLRKQAETVVKEAHQSAATVVGSKEPAYVAHLCHNMPRLAARWSYMLRRARPGLTLDLNSVFTHSVPHVRNRITGKTCELADLLVVVIDRRMTPHRGNATLIQAKLNAAPLLSLKPKEMVQLELLKNRPPFDIVSPRVVTPAPFNIAAVDPSATCYGGGFLRAAGSPGWFSAASSGVASPWLAGLPRPRSFASPNLINMPSLLSFALTGLLAGTWGDHFIYDPTGKWWLLKDDWSKLVNYLLRAAGTSSHMKRASGGRTESRWNGTAMHLQTPVDGRIHHIFTFTPKDEESELLARLKIVAPTGSGGDGGNIFEIGSIDGDSSGGPPSVVEFGITGERAGDDWEADNSLLPPEFSA